MFPEGVTIDALTGAVSPSTGEYTKRLGEFHGIYRDEKALDALMKAQGDLVTYKVTEYRAQDSDIFFGTTTMMPGRVGDEYFMTRGHYHARRDRGEIYYTQSGQGVLLLQSRGGETREVEMKPGVCAFIPPDWAHRSINTGTTSLVFVWCCNQDAGHDYAEIVTKGMRKLVIERDGAATCIPNPKFAA
ncbi:MAG: glucose-6-phosphate isomerase family protein [Aestuariivirga sp.]